MKYRETGTETEKKRICRARKMEYGLFYVRPDVAAHYLTDSVPLSR